MDLNRLGRGSVGNAYARLHGVDDPNSVSTLAPEILPTVSIWERPEMWALLGGRLAGIRFSAVAPGAGNANGVLVNNRAGSNMLLIMTHAFLDDTNEWKAAIIGFDTGVMTLGVPRSRDNRSGADSAQGLGASVRIGSRPTDTLVGSPSLVYTGRAIVELEYVIPPGFAFAIQTQDNVASDIALWWRERPAAPQELDPL